MALIDFKRIERVVKLDKTVFREIRDEKDAMVPALVVLLVASIIGSIWTIVMSLGVALVAIVIGAPIGWFIGTGICHIIAKLLGGKSSFEGYLKNTAYAEAPTALGIVPIIGMIVGGIWALVCFIVATREAHELSTIKAILVVIIPAIVIGLLFAMFFALLLPASMMTSQYGSY